MNGFKSACLAGAMALSLAAAARAGHNENVQVVRVAQVLAQQATYLHQQAHQLMAGGWGASWQDQQAAREIHQFAQLASQLYTQAYQLENGNGGWNGGGGGYPHAASLDHRGHNDEQIGWQLRQLFQQTWSAADRVEHLLYQANRLRQLRGYWDYQVCGSLRALRQALNGLGGGHPWGREERRTNKFNRLFSQL